MKIVEECRLIKGGFCRTKAWKQALGSVRKAILAVDWPRGSGKFTIRPESGKKRGEGNGVKPIKEPCVAYLSDRGWQTEKLPKLSSVLRPGDLDALRELNGKKVGFEWETGNISSSHRALNKLLLTMLDGALHGGILIVPSDKLKRYLTDRVGNIGELRPYFPLWRSIRVNACLYILAVEHDQTDPHVPRIPKGTDGRATN